jgi:diacylglycerol kinase family enzyme
VFEQAIKTAAVSDTDLTMQRAVASVGRNASGAALRAGVICNPKSHRNRSGERAFGPFASPDVSIATPRTRDELTGVLQGFARDGIDVLVIAGGDGTVRDVLTRAGTIWTTDWPRIAVVPSGKTNALALDLGVPPDWTIEQALDAAATSRCVERQPLEIVRRDGRTLRGFLFGTGAFVSATALAQRTHRVGAFHGVAVTLALGWAVLQTIFGRATSQWRVGEETRLRAALAGDAGELAIDDRRYLLLASTLKRLPVGLKPFGTPRTGMKLLVVDAPPRRMIRAVPLLLSGSESAWLEASGYRRYDAGEINLTIDRDFILDGEIYPGGDLTIRPATPLRFVVP